MLALVTGASSGIGYEIAIKLSKLGYDVIAVGRNEKKLKELKENCNTCVCIEILDLLEKDNIYLLYEKYKGKNIDILVNSAGIGDIGEFFNTDLNIDLELISLNITATHILTKLFLEEMIKRDSGYILNVTSSAAFAPGPLMATYYATKAYVFKVTTSISKELKKAKSKVVLSVLCPGPVDTNFNNKLNISFSIKPVSAKYVSEYALKKLLKNNKKVIIPGIKNKMGVFLSKVLPNSILEEYIYNMQKGKLRTNKKVTKNNKNIMKK